MAQAQLGGCAALVPVAGGSLEVEVMGAGPAIMFVHGWTLDRRMWQPQVAALAQDYRVITYDRRGFGRSDAPPDLARECDDILAIADALEVDRFALVGMSQGGRVALAFAAHHADRLWALAVQGAPLSGVAMGDEGDEADGDGAEEAIPLADMAALARAGDLHAMRALWLRHPLMQTDDGPAWERLEAMVHDYAARDLLGNGGSLDVVEASLTGITLPTLIITGEREPAWRHKVAAVLQGAMPYAQRAVIEGGGHLCNLCRADRYNGLLASFLHEAGGDHSAP